MQPKLSKILLVDFDFDELAQAQQISSVAGCDFYACLEVEAAVALLYQENFAAILINLLSPVKERRDLLKLIRFVSNNFPKTKVMSVNLNDSLNDGLRRVLLDLELTESVSKIQLFKKLDDVLADIKVKALLQPIVPLIVDGSNRLHGIESLARAQGEFSHWNTEFLFAYAALKEKLFDIEIRCINAAIESYFNFDCLGELFLNIRPRTLADPRFVELITKILDVNGLQPHSIVFEMTEQQSILNFAVFLQTVSELRQLGFGIAVDDFGVGFANLQLVQELRPDYIKLSGIFCRGIEEDRAKQVVVTLVTQMARELKIATILENIETESEMEIAKNLRVNFGQGYHICRPMDAEALKNLRHWSIR